MSTHSVPRWLSLCPPLYATARSQATNWALIAAFLIYALVTFITMLHHESWRDEAYVWLMARDMSITALYHELNYNGSPGLWHLLVMPLAKSGMPYSSQQWLHWALACVASGIFLAKSPFHPWIRIGYIAGYYIAYEHVAIVRVYMLSLLLLYVTCILFPTRLSSPLRYGLAIGLLANTNLFALCAAALFGGEFCWQLCLKRHLTGVRALAIALMLTGGVFSLISMLPPSDGLHYYAQWFNYYMPERVPFMLNSGFLFDDWRPRYAYPGAAYAVLIVVFYSYLCLRWRAYFPLMLVVSLWVVLLYLGVFKYPWFARRHYGFFWIYIVIGLWLAQERASHSPLLSRLAFLVLIPALCLSAADSARNIRLDIAHPYSGSREMAAYLREHELTGHIIIGHSMDKTAAVLPYLPESTLWYPETLAFGTVVIHRNPRRVRFSAEELLDLANQHLPNEREVLFLLDTDILVDNDRLQRLHESWGIKEPLTLFKLLPQSETR